MRAPAPCAPLRDPPLRTLTYRQNAFPLLDDLARKLKLGMLVHLGNVHSILYSEFLAFYYQCFKKLLPHLKCSKKISRTPDNPASIAYSEVGKCIKKINKHSNTRLTECDK